MSDQLGPRHTQSIHRRAHRQRRKYSILRRRWARSRHTLTLARIGGRLCSYDIYRFFSPLTIRCVALLEPLASSDSVSAPSDVRHRVGDGGRRRRRALLPAPPSEMKNLVEGGVAFLVFVFARATAHRSTRSVASIEARVGSAGRDRRTRKSLLSGRYVSVSRDTPRKFKAAAERRRAIRSAPLTCL
ncbi:hypothetical protein EVAR_83586_1 [Eumeta japonica]|uniref:Uncharacterized protein n=1 Tax=Eumeta variegata TaxID=151549 RepID=A0A4C1UPH2_EUMVA|nr:hypothetical protein EVAR_83586_1 [Eumeta japonica]